MKNIAFICFALFALPLFLLQSCKTTDKNQEPVFDKIEKNAQASGDWLEIRLVEGPAHNHPLMAIWLEDKQGNFIQTLFVSESIAKGVFQHGKEEEGQWMPGEIQRPAALPVWTHRHNDTKNEFGYFLPTPSDPIADTYSGATPLRSFILKVKTEQPIKEPVKVFLEINQAFDWNDHWTNNKFPADDQYKTSGQPALVYSGILKPRSQETVNLQLVGHSHYSGKDGKLYDNISTISTAKNITRAVSVQLVEQD